jgi:hypothetical protein
MIKIALGSVLLVLAVTPGHPAHSHDIYSGIMKPDGSMICCNDRDCRQVPWREVDGAIEYNLDGYWVRGSKHNTVAPIDGQAHACWVRSARPNPRCLMPPGFGA